MNTSSTPAASEKNNTPTRGVNEFNLTGYFSVLVLLLLLLAGLSLSQFIQRTNQAQLHLMAEQANEDLARVFRHSLWHEFSDLVDDSYGKSRAELLQDMNYDELHNKTAALMDGTGVVKIRIYNLDGLTVFSSDPMQIGEDQSQNSGFLRAREGDSVSNISFRGRFDSFRGEIIDRDIFHSYIPSTDDSQIDGVLEVYHDVSDIKHQIEAGAKQILQSILLVLIILFLLLFALMYWLNLRIIRKQQALEAQTERAALAMQEADRANQAKSEFLSSMSHELRTPLNAILGFGQLLEYDDSLSEQQRENVKDILKAGSHLLELINEVLDLAKVESGSIDLSLEPVEICSVVDECIGLLTPLAERRSITLKREGLTGAAVRADRTRFKQVLLNLISNAIKYNREGGRVTVDAQTEGDDRLRIRVTDTGQGIPANRLDELFQPFNRLGAEATEIEGTGIGLTITRRIIEMMGGSVDVESKVGMGSSFWIELPLETQAIACVTSSNALSPMHAVSVQPAAADRHTVLYIEDNPANLKLVSQILGRMPNIQLLTAHTPALGIELALMRQPDLIMVDINMPGMNGYQMLQAFKAEPSLKDTPVIAITANAMPRDIKRGEAAGFFAYLTKPLDVRRFMDTVNRCLVTRVVRR